MTNNTPENITTSWRDLADQLTQEQIAELEEREHDPDRLVRVIGNPELRWTNDALLDSARHLARNNLGAAMIGEVPPPAGAVKVTEWLDDSPEPFRYFEGSRHVIERDERSEDIHVYVAGIQYVDGRVQREIVVHQLHADEPLRTLAQARQLADAINAAADGWETSGNQVTPSDV